MTGKKLEERPAIGARVSVTGFRGTVVEASTPDMRRNLIAHPDRVWVSWDGAFSQCIAWAELEELDEELDDDDDEDARRSFCTICGAPRAEWKDTRPGQTGDDVPGGGHLCRAAIQ